ncbi:MAG TPA: hypothetical protein VFE47_18520 [Tepidisphaeraceae bacterium]|jgi:hypothetical protein|nr:hypothetical protein [Tepidisphaeraceae bacterium]
MRRRLFNFLSAISLLLCLCLAALWVLSYSHEEGLGWASSTINAAGAATNGHLVAEFYRLVPNQSEPAASGFKMRSVPNNPDEYLDIDGLLTIAGSHGFRWHSVAYVSLALPSVQHYHLILVPLWLLMLPTLILPATWLLRRRRTRLRQRTGLCPHCGYDLRATPGRCPECGREKSEDKNPRMATNEHE